MARSNRKSSKIESGRKPRRMQTAIEYLSVYSWALIVLIIVIVAVSFLAFNHSTSTYLPSTCYISPNFNCQQMFVMSNSTGAKALIIFTNNFASNVMFSANAFGIEPGTSGAVYAGNCYPAIAAAGSSVTCAVFIPSYSPGLGSQLNPRIVLSYSVCSGSNCQQQQTLNTSGTSTVYVSPFEPTQVVTLKTSNGQGEVSLNGVNYPSNTQLVFVNGLSYTVYANPPPGFGFSYWSPTNGVNVPANSIYNQQAPVNALTVGTLTAVLVGMGGVTLSCQSYTVKQSQSNLCIATGNTLDNIYICISGNGAPSTNLTTACNPPDDYWVGVSANQTGNATFNTQVLPSGVYYLEGCDISFEQATGKTDCTSPQLLQISPTPALNIQSNTTIQGTPDAVTATTSNSFDMVVLCSNYNGGLGRLYACVGANNQVGNATGSYTNTLTSFPVGTYKFAACDWTYYLNTSVADCSPVQEVTILPPPPTVTFSCQNDTPLYLQNDPCSGSATYNSPGVSGASDIIDVCGNVGTVAGINSPYQGVPPFRNTSICGNHYNYIQNNAVGTAQINLNNYNTGTYEFKACDQSYRLKYNISAGNTVACSPVVTVMISQPNCNVLDIEPAQGTSGYSLTGVTAGNCPNGLGGFVACSRSGTTLKCSYAPGTNVTFSLTPSSGQINWAPGSRCNLIGTLDTYGYDVLQNYQSYVTNYCTTATSPTGTGTYTIPMEHSDIQEFVNFENAPSALSVSVTPASDSVNTDNSVTYTATVSGGYPSVNWGTYCGSGSSTDWSNMPCIVGTGTCSDYTCTADTNRQAGVTMNWQSTGTYSGTMKLCDSEGECATSNRFSTTVTSPWTAGYDCIANYAPYDGSALSYCQSLGYETCEGSGNSGCPVSTGYPDVDCGWPAGYPGTMCYTYGANPGGTGVEADSGIECDGLGEQTSDNC